MQDSPYISDSSLYANPALVVTVSALLLLLAFVYLVRRKPARMLAIFCVAHVLVFVHNEALFISSELVLPFLAIEILRGSKRREGDALVSRYHRYVFVFVTALVFTGLLAVASAKFSYGMPEWVAAMKFLVWMILPIAFVARVDFGSVDEETRLVLYLLPIVSAITAVQLILSALSVLFGGVSFLDVLAQRTIGGYISTPAGASNTLAAFMALGVVAAMGLMAMDSRHRLLLKGLVGLCLAGILLTTSRGVLVSLLCVWLWHIKIWKRLSWKYAVIALLFSAIFVPVIANSMGDSDNPFVARLTSRDIATGDVKGYGEDISSGRFTLWGIAALNIAANPYTGVGFHNASALELAGASTAHNIFLNMMEDSGLLGFIPFFLLFLFLIRLRRRVVRALAESRSVAFDTLTALLLLALLNMQIESPEANAQYMFFVALVMSLFVMLGSHLLSSAEAQRS